MNEERTEAVYQAILRPLLALSGDGEWAAEAAHQATDAVLVLDAELVARVADLEAERDELRRVFHACRERSDKNYEGWLAALNRVADLEAAQQQVVALANEMGDGVSPECSGFAERILAVSVGGTSTPADGPDLVERITLAVGKVFRQMQKIGRESEFDYADIRPAVREALAAAPEGSGT